MGCFNAFFTAVVGIPSFIATLGSSTLIFGFTLYIGYAQSFSAQYPPTGHTVPKSEYHFFTDLSNAHLPGKFPMQGLWMIALLVIFGFLLGRSLFGFRLKAIGGNRRHKGQCAAARRDGVCGNLVDGIDICREQVAPGGVDP